MPLGSSLRSASRLVYRLDRDLARLFSWVALLLFALALAAPSSRGKDATPKHYLTFQIGYVGSATRSSQDADGQGETSLEVNDRFSGRIEVRPTEAYDLPTDQSAEAQLKEAEAMRAAVLAGDVEKLHKTTPRLLVTWFPRGDRVEITGRISETKTSRGSRSAHGETRASSDDGTETYKGQKVFEGNVVNAFVKIRAEEKRYDLQFTLMPDMATTGEAVHQTLVRDHTEEGHNTHSESEANVPLDMGPGQMNLGYSNYLIVADVKGQALAGEAGELIGTTRIPVPKPAGWDGSWDIALDVSWQIDVTLPPVELFITAAGYDEWRPEGNLKKPTEPGNNLRARATVVAKEGQGTFVPRVKNIHFQLLDTSREPGVCLNWPLNAKDQDYDLRLAAVAGGTLSRSDQILEVADPKRDEKGQPYAEVQIDSYDFGGRALLRAVCLLNDGREIEGVMQEVGETPRLPKMKGPGWIADTWRKAHHAEKLADEDDNEKVEGQKDDGDGFTLYEEYRGWVVNGMRLEGDPEGKDFFVLNLIGGDAESGIDLFEQLSELKVHSKLRRGEMSEKTRLMNGNHRDAPHRVDQHGVWVQQYVDDPKGTKDGATGKEKLRSTGASTALTKAGVAGRPGIVLGVGILARDNTEGDFSKPFNLPAQDAIFAWDRAIAHELLHSVGVEHHGPDDTTGYSFSFVPPNVPDNKIGRPHYRLDGETVVNLLEENGHDLAAQAYPLYVKMREMLVASGLGALIESLYGKSFQDKPVGSPAFKAFVDEYIDQLTRAVFGARGMVGQEHFSHSGDQDCVMRYYFAKFYDAKNTKEKTVYLVTPGTERIGLEICRSAKGTGANAPNPPNLPQSRYGDAAQGAGNCFAQICPNDAIPPRKTK